VFIKNICRHFWRHCQQLLRLLISGALLDLDHWCLSLPVHSSKAAEGPKQHVGSLHSSSDLSFLAARYSPWNQMGIDLLYHLKRLSFTYPPPLVFHHAKPWCQQAGKQLCRKGHRYPGGHQVEEKSAIRPCSKGDLLRTGLHFQECTSRSR